MALVVLNFMAVPPAAFSLLSSGEGGRLFESLLSLVRQLVPHAPVVGVAPAELPEMLHGAGLDLVLVSERENTGNTPWGAWTDSVALCETVWKGKGGPLLCLSPLHGVVDRSRCASFMQQVSPGQSAVSCSPPPAACSPEAGCMVSPLERRADGYLEWEYSELRFFTPSSHIDRTICPDGEAIVDREGLWFIDEALAYLPGPDAKAPGSGKKQLIPCTGDTDPAFWITRMGLGHLRHLEPSVRLEEER